MVGWWGVKKKKKRCRQVFSAYASLSQPGIARRGVSFRHN